jgi:hypothetical protein
MHPNIKKLAQLAPSFAIYDKVVRYTFAEIEDPSLASWLQDPNPRERPRVLAVDLAHEEVIIGVMMPESPWHRSMLSRRIVCVPRGD